MASTGKNKRKLKGKTLNLNEFLEKETNYVVSSKLTDWATEMENVNPDDEWGPDSHPFKTSIDRSILPTAPRAARGPDIDINRVPNDPPFIAFLGNLPFNMDHETITRFFRGMDVTSVRLPKGNESGLKRGFGYAEFGNRESLIQALSMNNETLMNRKIRIDLAENEKEDKDRRNDKSDRTAGDWRRVPDSDFSQHDRDSYDNRDRNDRDYSSRDIDRHDYSERNYDERDRGYDRDRGFDRDRGDRGNDRDRVYNDRSGYNDRYDRFERGHSSDRDRGYGSDRERGYNNDRGRGDRYDRNDRYGERFNRDGERDYDRGYDRNSRRTFGSGFSNDRDSYDDRRRDDRRYDNRYGSLGRRGGFGDSRQERSGSPDKYRDDNKSEKDPPHERQKLVLKPRSIPLIEVNVSAAPAQTQASIFGGAKPVDTAAREREIEERLARERAEEIERLQLQENREKERESDRERDSRDREDTYADKREKLVYNEGPRNFQKEEKDFNNRKASSSSVKSDKSGGRSRGDSERSGHSQSETDEEKDRREVVLGKPPSPKKEDYKAVPAPLPKENAWQKRAAATGSILPTGLSNERREQSRDRAGSDRENRPGYNTTPRTKRKGSASSSGSNGPRRASVDYGRERRPSIDQRPPSGRRGSEDATSYGFWDRRDTSRNRARDDSRNRRRDDQHNRNNIRPQRPRDEQWDRGRGRGERPSERGRGRSERGRDRQVVDQDDHNIHKGHPRDLSDRPPRRGGERSIKYEEPKPMNWTNVNKFNNLLMDDDGGRDSN